MIEKSFIYINNYIIAILSKYIKINKLLRGYLLK